MKCTKCGQDMILSGKFFFCGNHEEPVFIGADQVEPIIPNNWKLGDSREFPHPIAVCVEKILNDQTNHVSYLERLFSIRDLIEVMIKYLCFIRLSICLQEKRLTEIERKEIAMNLAKPSLGTWLSLLMDLMKKESLEKGYDATPLISIFLKPNFKQKKLSKQLHEFVAFRNTIIGHGARVHADEYKSYFQKWFQIIHEWEELFSHLKMLKLTYHSSSHEHMIEGPVPPLSLEQVDIGELMVEDLNHEKYSLNPFLFVHYCESCHGSQIFMYDSNKNYGGTSKQPKIHVLEYLAGHKPAIHSPITELENVFGKELLAEAFKHVKVHLAEIEGKILTWDKLIEDHAHITGREFLKREIEDFISNHDSGIFLLTADPGVGKTAFMCNLTYDQIHNGDIRAYFFYRRVAGIQSPDQAVKSIYFSLLKSIGVVESNPTQDLSELRNKLNNLLIDISQNYLRVGENCIILIDALDEAIQSFDHLHAFDVIPKDLPKGIYFIVSSRNDTDVLEKKNGKNIKHYEIKTSSNENINDLANYISSQLPLDLVNEIDSSLLAKNYQGNFLLAQLVMEALHAGDFDRSSIEEMSLFKEAKDYYDSYWNYLRTKVNEDDLFYHLIYRMLGILTITKAPLNEEQLTTILHLRLGELERAIRYVRQFLHVIPFSEENETYYRLFHETFRQFLLTKIKYQTRELHELIVNYAKDDFPVEDENVNSYGIRFKLYHLAHAGKIDELIDWTGWCLRQENEKVKIMFVESMEDLLHDSALWDGKTSSLTESTLAVIYQYKEDNHIKGKVDLLSFLIYLLQRKFGTEGISLYFRYIVRDLPTPLARLGKMYSGCKTSFEKLHKLIDIGEFIIKFQAVVGISFVLEEYDTSEDFVKNLPVLLRNPALGTFIDLIKKCSTMLYETNNTTYQDYISIWFQVSDGRLQERKEMEIFKQFIEQRNFIMNKSSEEIDEITMNSILEKVQFLMNSLQFFSKLKLVKRREDESLSVYMGENKDGFLTESTYEIGRLDKQSCYFLLPDGRFINLHPFILLTDTPNDVEILIFRRWTLNSIEYTDYFNNYQYKIRQIANTPGHPISSIEFGIVKPNRKSLFVKNAHQFVHIARKYIERREDEEQITNFIKNKPSGFQYIYAPAGYGKTTLLKNVSIYLSLEFTSIFLNMEIIQSKEDFLGFVCRELEKKLHLKQEDISDRRFLELAKLSRNKIVLILDGVDAFLERHDREGLFKDHLHHIHVIYAARYIHPFYEELPADSIKRNIIEWKSYETRNLIYEEISKYDLKEEDVLKMVEMAKGNPLMVSFIIETLKMNPKNALSLLEKQSNFNHIISTRLMSHLALEHVNLLKYIANQTNGIPMDKLIEASNISRSELLSVLSDFIIVDKETKMVNLPEKIRAFLLDLK